MTTIPQTPVQASAKPARQPELKALPIYVTNIDAAEGIVDAVVNVFGIIDLGDDIIHNGAYTKTLNERGNKVRVKVLDSHNNSSIFNVLGKPLEIREIGRDELARLAPEVIAQHPDATGGLFTKTQYNLSTEKGREAFTLIAGGDVNEYSIALDPLEVDYSKKTVNGKERMIRNIRQIRLVDYSPVVFGMNQATVTTDVKAQGDMPADEDKAETPAPAVVPTVEMKMGTLGAKLEASMRISAAFCVNDWLSMGTIMGEQVAAVNDAVEAGMTALRGALPADIATMTMHDYWSADGAGEAKAGRMISGANREKIQACIDVLQALMDASTPADVEETMNEEVEKSRDTQVLTTGTGANATPSIPEPGGNPPPEQVALDADTIDRELSELILMKEYAA